MTSDRIKRKREGGREGGREGKDWRVSLLAASRFLFVRRWDMGFFSLFFIPFLICCLTPSLSSLSRCNESVGMIAVFPFLASGLPPSLAREGRDINCRTVGRGRLSATRDEGIMSFSV